ncbi:MAG: hypothetical protein N3B13_00170 [Deltaproteobacteria bacterium]|nr:hypothetical protein [Deltaproteobacteria bacterium]
MMSEKISIKNVFVSILVVALIPVFFKIADFSRFVIFTTNIHELLSGILKYLIKNYLILLLLSVIGILSLSVFVLYKAVKRKIYRNIWILSGVIVFLVQIFPVALLKSVKPELLAVYAMLFILLFLFLLLREREYDFLKTFFYTVLILFPLFSLFLMIGFEASAARPKRTILNGGPEHNILDERCDRKRLLSQKEIKPIWLEDAWLYGGVATKDGRYIYFADNGYGIVGFEIKDDGNFEKLPFVKYPPNFNAALYSHRLYLTPDEKYLYYYGARSAEFVFIDRERLEVAYVIPTRNGLDGFSATMDTKRNLIYGFPFIGKEVPVLSYENGLPRLIKWIDFSQVSGWAIQGTYSLLHDILYITTTSNFAGFEGATLMPLFNTKIGPTVARLFYDEKGDRFFGTNYFFNHVVVFGRSWEERIDAPSGSLEVFYDGEREKLYTARLSCSEIWVKDLSSGREKIIYTGPRPRGFLKAGGKILFSSGCGIHQIFF